MTEEELLGYFTALNTDGDDYLNKDEFMAMAKMDGKKEDGKEGKWDGKKEEGKDELNALRSKVPEDPKEKMEWYWNTFMDKKKEIMYLDEFRLGTKVESPNMSEEEI